MTDCIFCKIAGKIIPANIVKETNDIIAFRDLDAKAPAHILVIPKIHISSTRDFNSENIHILGSMALAAKEICIEEGISEKGYRWVINTGADGGQTVFHIHLHILGGRVMSWPPG